MIDQAGAEFYAHLRDKPDLWSELARIDDPEEFYDAVVAAAVGEGYHLDANMVRSVTAEEFLALLQGVANDDELTDEELELVAAGSPVACDDT